MSVLSDVAANTGFRERLVTTAPGVNTPLCQPDTRRYAIGFAAPQNGVVSITTRTDANASEGFTLPFGGVTWFTVKDHGPLAQAAWFDSNKGGGVLILVLEVLLPKG